MVDAGADSTEPNFQFREHMCKCARQGLGNGDNLKIDTLMAGPLIALRC